MKQYEKFRTKGAFLNHYKDKPGFEDYSEFDDAHNVVQDLIDEYKAAETQNYVDWGK